MRFFPLGMGASEGGGGEDSGRAEKAGGCSLSQGRSSVSIFFLNKMGSHWSVLSKSEMI